MFILTPFYLFYVFYLFNLFNFFYFACFINLFYYLCYFNFFMEFFFIVLCICNCILAFLSKHFVNYVLKGKYK